MSPDKPRRAQTENKKNRLYNKNMLNNAIEILEDFFNKSQNELTKIADDSNKSLLERRIAKSVISESDWRTTANMLAEIKSETPDIETVKIDANALKEYKDQLIKEFPTAPTYLIEIAADLLYRNREAQENLNLNGLVNKAGSKLQRSPFNDIAENNMVFLIKVLDTLNDYKQSAEAAELRTLLRQSRQKKQD